jgi:HD-like signal output (HDOD) protein
MPDAHGSPCQETNEGAILELLLGSIEHRIWSVDELAREVGSPITARDAISGLYTAGLVHRFGEFVFATRAAVHHDQIGA